MKEEFEQLIPDAKILETHIKEVYNGKSVTSELIDDIREFMLKQNGEINTERAQIIKEFTELKVVPRQVNTIEGAITVFGLQYKDIGIEFARAK